MYFSDKKLKILVIEDNLGDFVLIEQYLIEQFLTPVILHSTTFKDAQKYLSKETKLNVILLDLSLPDANGKDLVNNVISKVQSCSVIVLTGYSDKNFGIETLTLGVSDYLLKDELNGEQLFKSISYSIERKYISHQLQKSEEVYRNIFENSPLPMWVFDSETLRFLSVNNAAINHYGYTKEEFLSMTIKDIRPTEDIHLLDKAIQESKTQGIFYSNSFRHKKKNDEIIYVDIQSNEIIFDEKKARLVHVIDITEKLKNEQHLRLLESVITNTTDAVLITEAHPIDEPGPKIIYVNSAFCKMTGYNDEEVIGKSPRFLQGIKSDKTELKKLRKAMENGKPSEIEIINYKKNGEEFWVQMAIAPVIDTFGKITHFIAIERDVTENKKQDLIITKTILNTQEKERYYIGGELHDNVNQLLGAAQIALSMINKSSIPSEELIEKSDKYIETAINEIRRISHRLSPTSFDDRNLKEAFEELLNNINIENKYHITLKFELEKGIELNKDIQLNLYRILQEQLTNITKHSESSQIMVQLVAKNNAVKMQITDNGRGLDSTVMKKGIGLSNIKKRAELFSGFFSLNSSLGNGCDITVEIPIDDFKPNYF